MDKVYRYMAILVTWDQLKKYGQINFFSTVVESMKEYPKECLLFEWPLLHCTKH